MKKIKNFTINNAIDFFRSKLYSNIEFFLDRWHKITFLISWKVYSFTISGSEVNFKSKTYTNYSTLLNDCYKLLLKNKLIIRNQNTITITNTISDFSILEEEQSKFSLDSLLKSKPQNIEWISNLTDEDITEIILNDNLEKWFVKDGVITLIMKQWSTYVRQYNRLTFINLLIKYIEILVENKKKERTIKINNTISLYFQTKSQNLSIIEWIEWDWEIISVEEDDKGYIDTNLINNNFILCSLSDLVIDKMKLKIWLNKIIINTETISKFYFN